MPTRQISNGNVTVWWVPSIANGAAPTATEINAGKNLSAAISWNNFELGSSGSADVDDRAITDLGNAISRGFPDFGATLAFFREANSSDSASIYQQAFTLFKTPGLTGYLVVRYGQALPSAVAAIGDVVSVYKVQTDRVSDDTEGDDSVKFEVNFLPQGALWEHTLVSPAGTLTATPTTLSLAAGKTGRVKITLAGKDVTAGAVYSSSDSTKAVANNGGTTLAVSAGSATITVSHPSATGTATVTVTIT
jgi:hypothetical protein